MQHKAATNNLILIGTSIVGEIDRLATVDRACVVRRLVQLADHAFAYRLRDRLKEVSDLLFSLSVSAGERAVAAYYRARSINATDADSARLLLESSLAPAPAAYKGDILLALSYCAATAGDLEAEVGMFFEALRASRGVNVAAAAQSLRMLAIVKARAGDHRAALRDLESLFPLAALAGRENARTYYDYLNSYAVELAECGRLEEAREVIGRVMRSPFAFYPEYRDTEREIESRLARRSLAAVSGYLDLEERKKALTARLISGGLPRRAVAEIVAVGERYS